QGRPIDKPFYSFSEHTRTPRTTRVNPAGVIIVDGILVLEDERVRALMDMKVYVDTDADVRFIRRLVRDTRDRGRTMESVIRQYLDTVRPMNNQFVEPTKKYADVIVPEGGFNTVAIDMLIASIRTRMGR
nr:uridine kinase [Bacillota bacterium]